MSDAKVRNILAPKWLEMVRSANNSTTFNVKKNKRALKSIENVLKCG